MLEQGGDLLGYCGEFGEPVVGELMGFGGEDAVGDGDGDAGLAVDSVDGDQGVSLTQDDRPRRREASRSHRPSFCRFGMSLIFVGSYNRADKRSRRWRYQPVDSVAIDFGQITT
ncbi:hypothetical protein ACTOB_003784 [Actinoplanes oblitus]|uniref:Uncharacterized protein n=1 Tax=Actinoplanes oblitus TaxID=3040509 RepID=A0ABY8WQE3_9ACTN|nr:hypothetical protein [Actinoplanes oblitus]WIN00102.1 hypothetical protein ACTOB_003784 [Actinoplanes oblitus]